MFIYVLLRVRLINVLMFLFTVCLLCLSAVLYQMSLRQLNNGANVPPSAVDYVHFRMNEAIVKNRNIDMAIKLHNSLKSANKQQQQKQNTPG